MGLGSTSARGKVVKVVKSGALLGAHTQNGQVVKVVKPTVPCMCCRIPCGCGIPWGSPVGPNYFGMYLKPLNSKDFIRGTIKKIKVHLNGLVGDCFGVALALSRIRPLQHVPRQ